MSGETVQRNQFNATNPFVVYVDLVLDCVITAHGAALPITDWIGPDGEESTKAEAVRCVAGMDGFYSSQWFNVDLVPQKNAH